MDEASLSQNIEIEPQPKPWGLWPTIGFTLAIAVAYFIISAIIITVFVISSNVFDPNLATSENIKNLEQNGTLLTLSEIILAPFIIGLVVLFARLRKGISVRQYLGLNAFDFKTLAKWASLLLIFAAATDFIKYLAHQPIVPEFMFKAYGTAASVPLLWCAIIIFAPLIEEFVFRGFLFEGIRFSRLGPVGAVILTSLFWTMLHSQYQGFDLVILFIGGLIMGIARIRGNSLWLPIALHSLLNLYATVEAAVWVQR